MSTLRTILVMAGGTGGHIYPALAVAEAMATRGWNVVWLGSRESMESKLVPTFGYPMRLVSFGGLRGKGLLAKLLLPTRLLVAFSQAARAIFAVKPNVVLGMGGYVSFPGGMMASLFNRPLVIHEQNRIAGLTNKVLAHIADRVLTGFPNALAKSEYTGNPVREQITSIAPPRERYRERGGRLRVLVVGGSLGAQALNEVLPKALALLPWDSRPSIMHQSGEKNIGTLRAHYKEAQVEGTLVSFIDDMAAAYAEADVVICRAGALTVAELSAAGVASVLVPYPNAVDDHQTANARFLSDAGAAILLPQSELNAERLAKLFLELTRGKLEEMAEKARAVGHADATDRVAGVCEAVAR